MIYATHNYLFLKVAIPLQCASLWCAMWHARVRRPCWQNFWTFQTYNTLSHPAFWITKFMQIVTNIFIFHSTQTFDLKRRVLARIWWNPWQWKHSPAIQERTLDIALQSMVEDEKTILYRWKMSTRWHIMSEKQLSILIEGRNYVRGDWQINRIPRIPTWMSAGAPGLCVALCKLTKFPRTLCDCACSQRHYTETFFHWKFIMW